MDELTWKWAFGPYLDQPKGQKESAIKAGYVKVVSKQAADKAIAELMKEISNLKAKNIELQSFYDLHENVDNYIDKLKAENTDLKAKLEDVQTSMYADVVDANMENRKLLRALWLARAERAKEHIWHEVNIDGSPKDDYTGYDWVLVQLQEAGGFELIPRIAEYRRHLKRWVFIDEDYDTENTQSFCHLRKQCKVIGWRSIDLAYYGQKFFVQQEINKNVERKCRAKAEAYR